MSDGVQPIRYGMFIMPFHDPAKPLGQCYDEDLELIIRAEELGFGEFWIGEHHTMKYENIVMPEIFGQGIGGGVYNLGTFLYDLATVIARNNASTSNDDIYPTPT